MYNCKVITKVGSTDGTIGFFSPIQEFIDAHKSNLPKRIEITFCLSDKDYPILGPNGNTLIENVDEVTHAIKTLAASSGFENDTDNFGVTRSYVQSKQVYLYCKSSSDENEFPGKYGINGYIESACISDYRNVDIEANKDHIIENIKYGQRGIPKECVGKVCVHLQAIECSLV